MLITPLVDGCSKGHKPLPLNVVRAKPKSIRKINRWFGGFLVVLATLIYVQVLIFLLALVLICCFEKKLKCLDWQMMDVRELDVTDDITSEWWLLSETGWLTHLYLCQWLRPCCPDIKMLFQKIWFQWKHKFKTLIRQWGYGIWQYF